MSARSSSRSSRRDKHPCKLRRLYHAYIRHGRSGFRSTCLVADGGNLCHRHRRLRGLGHPASYRGGPSGWTGRGRSGSHGLRADLRTRRPVTGGPHCEAAPGANRYGSAWPVRALERPLRSGSALRFSDRRARAGRYCRRSIHADRLRARCRAGEAGTQGVGARCRRLWLDGIRSGRRAVRCLLWPASRLARHLLVCGAPVGGRRRHIDLQPTSRGSRYCSAGWAWRTLRPAGQAAGTACAPPEPALVHGKLYELYLPRRRSPSATPRAK